MAPLWGIDQKGDPQQRVNRISVHAGYPAVNANCVNWKPESKSAICFECFEVPTDFSFQAHMLERPCTGTPMYWNAHVLERAGRARKRTAEKKTTPVISFCHFIPMDFLAFQLLIIIIITTTTTTTTATTTTS